ncbi:MAG: hypothetical protein LBD16_04895 [Oscillospiraceae bacterium]|nr:hypothetical protein [Oscillospiraceae bacterium]
MNVIKKTKNMNAKVAAVIMVLLVLCGILLGNRNALVHASVGVYAELADIRENTSQLASKAQNYLTLAGQIGLTGTEVENLENSMNIAGMLGNNGRYSAQSLLGAIDDLDTAKTALNAKIESLGSHETERKSVFNAWAIIKDNVMVNTEDYNRNVAEYRKVWNGTLMKPFADPPFIPIVD